QVGDRQLVEIARVVVVDRAPGEAAQVAHRRSAGARAAAAAAALAGAAAAVAARTVRVRRAGDAPELRQRRVREVRLELPVDHRLARDRRQVRSLPCRALAHRTLRLLRERDAGYQQGPGHAWGRGPGTGAWPCTVRGIARPRPTPDRLWPGMDGNGTD